MTKVKESLSEVLTKIKLACDRRPLELARKEVKLVAVSKTKSKEMIIEAYEYGQRYFGENYVNELYEKSHDLEILEKCSQIKWHFIGHLQKKNVNKLLAVRNLHLLETIENQELANKINNSLERDYGDRTINALLQVNTSEEEGKGGVEPTKTGQLLEYIINKCPRLKIVGLMTIGSLEHSIDTNTENPDFKCLLDCKRKICNQFQINPDEFELSMGMSSDFEQAVSINLKSSSLFYSDEPMLKKPHHGLQEILQLD